MVAISDGALVVATWDGEVAGEDPAGAEGEVAGAVPTGIDGVLLGALAGIEGVFFGAVPAGAEDEGLPVGYGGTTGERGALAEGGANDGTEEEATCEGED